MRVPGFGDPPEEERVRHSAFAQVMAWIDTRRYALTDFEGRLLRLPFDTSFCRSADTAFLFGTLISSGFFASRRVPWSTHIYAGLVMRDFALSGRTNTPLEDFFHTAQYLDSPLGEISRDSLTKATSHAKHEADERQKPKEVEAPLPRPTIAEVEVGHIDALRLVTTPLIILGEFAPMAVVMFGYLASHLALPRVVASTFAGSALADDISPELRYAMAVRDAKKLAVARVIDDAQKTAAPGSSSSSSDSPSNSLDRSNDGPSENEALAKSLKSAPMISTSKRSITAPQMVTGPDYIPSAGDFDVGVLAPLIPSRGGVQITPLTLETADQLLANAGKDDGGRQRFDGSSPDDLAVQTYKTLQNRGKGRGESDQSATQNRNERKQAERERIAREQLVATDVFRLVVNTRFFTWRVLEWTAISCGPTTSHSFSCFTPGIAPSDPKLALLASQNSVIFTKQQGYALSRLWWSTHLTMFGIPGRIRSAAERARGKKN